MHRISFIAFLTYFSISIFAANTDTVPEPYHFETIIELPITSVKNQHRSSTCWSFASLSFLESEVLRKGGDSLDLSEMFVVRHCYEKKADKYVRMHGNTSFSPGGAYDDVFYVMNTFGLVPESAYRGLKYGESLHVHGELDKVLLNYVDAILSNKNTKLSTAWKKGFSSVCDSYFGEIPDRFIYKGKEYSPKSFAQKKVKLNSDDYVSITSFTHHPFYSKFVLEIPDNWLWHASYNVHLDELVHIIHYALENGYTIAWGGDVSHKGFSFSNGLAIVPDVDVESMSGLERAKWDKLSSSEQALKQYQFKTPCHESIVTQEDRQIAFDNFSTTDDHGMHLVGLVKDQNGKSYFIIKNSWGTKNKKKGLLYMSEAYVRLNTINIVLHKDGIPKKIRKNLDL